MTWDPGVKVSFKQPDECQWQQACIEVTNEGLILNVVLPVYKQVSRDQRNNLLV